MEKQIVFLSNKEVFTSSLIIAENLEVPHKVLLGTISKIIENQTKLQSHLEVTTNQILGIIGGWLIVYYLFPLFDDLSQEIVATISTIIFFIWSYIRSYIVRRYFNKRIIDNDK